MFVGQYSHSSPRAGWRDEERGRETAGRESERAREGRGEEGRAVKYVSSSNPKSREMAEKD